jgi:phosphatidylserine decarboxylase
LAPRQGSTAIVASLGSIATLWTKVCRSFQSAVSSGKRPLTGSVSRLLFSGDLVKSYLVRFQTLFEARWIFAVLVLLTFVSSVMFPPLGFVFLLLILYTVFFFRDPERIVPEDSSAIVAAADGRVMEIAEIDEPDVLKAKTRRVGIFLSIFDVHTNRAPIEGHIFYRQRREGLCLDARRADCSTKNEAMTWGFENAGVRVVVRQLTGAIARRIVAWSDVGDYVDKGERFGMIRFGSRTEVYLPLTATVLVKVGDHVSAGSTIIARLAEA